MAKRVMGLEQKKIYMPIYYAYRAPYGWLNWDTHASAFARLLAVALVCGSVICNLNVFEFYGYLRSSKYIDLCLCGMRGPMENFWVKKRVQPSQTSRKKINFHSIFGYFFELLRCIPTRATAINIDGKIGFDWTFGIGRRVRGMFVIFILFCYI